MISFNVYKIKISGLNLHSVLDFFEREKITAKKIRRPDHKTLICTLNEKEYKAFINHSISKAYTTEIIYQHGVKRILRFSALHLGLFFGLALCLSFFFLNANKIQKVIINNSSHQCQNNGMCILKEENLNKIYEHLKDFDICQGKEIPKPEILRQVENQLILEFDQISGATINIKGSYVFIDIVEARLPEKETSYDLISPVSGIIVSSYVTSGKLLVKNGDIVIKGQKLVETVDDNKVVADFEIRTFYHESMVYDQEQIKYIKTGKKTTFNDISLWGINLKNNKLPHFPFYETETTNSYLSLNMILPIKIISTTYFELSAINENPPFNEVQDELKKELYLNTKSLLDENSTEKNTTYATFTEGSKTRVDCYIEAIYKLSCD